MLFYGREAAALYGNVGQRGGCIEAPLYGRETVLLYGNVAQRGGGVAQRDVTSPRLFR